MSKIFNFYYDDVDHTWYDSSNIKYTECVDHENELKELTVTFKNGTRYKYTDVNVQDYLLFREDASQGKALNKYIKGKGYEYAKLDNADIEALDDELNYRANGGLFIDNRDCFTLLDGKNSPIYKQDATLDEDNLKTMIGVLNAVGVEVKTIGDDGNNTK